MGQTQPDNAPKLELIERLLVIKTSIEEAKKPAQALCTDAPSQQKISDLIDKCGNCLDKLINFLENKDKQEIDDILKNLEKKSQNIDKNA